MTDTQEKEMIEVHVNVEIPTETLQVIVDTAKQLNGRNEKGYYTIDMADVVSDMITKFLNEKDFGAYVADRENYRSIVTRNL